MKVIIEGARGEGKTAVAEAIALLLQDAGHEVVVEDEPYSASYRNNTNSGTLKKLYYIPHTWIKIETKQEEN